MVMTALISGLATNFMGLYANLPLALSCGMGTNFMLGALINSGTVSFGWVMTLLLCSGIMFVMITVLGVRKVVVEMLTKNLKIATTTAVGFFIAYLGLKNTGLASFESGLALGDFTSSEVQLALITMLIIAALTVYKVRGAILIGIIAGTIIGIPMGITVLPESVIAAPNMGEIGNLMFSYDFKSILANIPSGPVWVLFCLSATSLLLSVL